MDTDIPNELDFHRNRFGERYLHAVNRRSFEAEPSSDVFARRLESEFGAENHLFVVVGSDSGLLASHLERPGRLGKGSRALIVETDELHALIAPASTARADARVVVRPSSDWRTALGAMQLERYVYGGAVEIVESLGCVHDHGGRYVSLLRDVRAGIDRAAQDLVSAINGRDFTRAQLRNACDNVRPAGALRGIGEGHTAIVLGAGPSLDTSIGWLLERREDLFVIAVSRISGKLRRLGIRPDVVVAIDPLDILHDVSKEGFLWEDVPLVSAHHVCPALLQQWRGPRFYLGPSLPWPSPDDPSRGNIAACGPTVSHAGAWLAAEWGFERILLSGVDLCYAVGGGTHAGGGVEDLVGFLPSHCDASVTTYAGRLAGTSLQLQQGVEQFERIGRTVNADGPRLVNLARDAARVEAVPYRATSDVEPPVGASRPSLPEASSFSRPHLERLRREHGRARHRFGTIARRCDEAVRLFDAMDASSDPARTEARRRRLDRLRRRLEREHGEWLAVLKRDAAAELLATLGPGGLDGVDDAGRRDWGRRYFRVLGRTAARFLELVESGDARARLRLAELDAAPDVDELLNRWESDGTPGRASLLQARLVASDASPLAPATAARLATTVDAFLADATETRDTGYARELRRRALDPHNVLRNLAFLLAQRSAEDLTALAERLRGFGEPTDTLGDYAAGLRAELDGDGELALRLHRRVLDRFGDWLEREDGVPPGFDGLLEDVLLRVASCQLEAGEGRSAAESLGLLAGLSPAYVTRHARLLQLLGEHDEALARLEEHVRAQPRDWRALLQVADLYAARGAGEAAGLARRLARETRDGDAQADMQADVQGDARADAAA